MILDVVDGRFCAAFGQGRAVSHAELRAFRVVEGADPLPVRRHETGDELADRPAEALGPVVAVGVLSAREDLSIVYYNMPTFRVA